MPSPERPGSHGDHRKEHEPIPYYQAARFSGEKPALAAYAQAQDALLSDKDCDLSAYRFLLNQVSHVVVLGEQPTPDLEQQLQMILATGESASLPPHVLKLLNERRVQATKLGPWVEGHYRPGIHVHPPEDEQR